MAAYKTKRAAIIVKLASTAGRTPKTMLFKYFSAKDDGIFNLHFVQKQDMPLHVIIQGPAEKQKLSHIYSHIDTCMQVHKHTRTHIHISVRI